MLFQLFKEAAGTEQEHAAVPEVTTGLDELLGALLIGLFNELGNPADTFGQQCVLA
ncbi:hypothetical protein D3C81_824520 [compost metagenome]